MIEFIYTYGDIIQFVIFVVNALAVAGAAVVATCYWVKYVNRTTACCAGDKSAPKAGEAPTLPVDVSKFVD